MLAYPTYFLMQNMPTYGATTPYFYLCSEMGLCLTTLQLFCELDESVSGSA